MWPRRCPPEHLWSGTNSFLTLWPLHTPGVQGQAFIILDEALHALYSFLLSLGGSSHKKQDSELHTKLGITAVFERFNGWWVPLPTSPICDPLGEAGLFLRPYCQG